MLVDYYLPGFRSGGPVRSVSNLVEQLGDGIAFYIITRDKDWRSHERYNNITDHWNRVGKAEVLYLPAVSLSAVLHAFREIKPHIILLNSFFSRFSVATLMLRRLGWLSDVPVLLAPRGELANGALGLKSIKKRAYCTLAKFLRLYSGVTWLATSATEEADIRRLARGSGAIMLAPNISSRFVPGEPAPRTKVPGALRIVWMGRVSPVKNLRFALEQLNSAEGDISFDIYGEIDTVAYWKECLEVMGKFPANIRVEYKGVLPHERVVETLGQYHLFYLPSTGENFGHAIFEAFNAGTPVLISDSTPWRDLSKHSAGWDLPLQSPTQWQACLRELVELDQSGFDLLSKGARKVALSKSSEDAHVLLRSQFLRLLSKEKNEGCDVFGGGS